MNIITIFLVFFFVLQASYVIAESNTENNLFPNENTAQDERSADDIIITSNYDFTEITSATILDLAQTQNIAHLATASAQSTFSGYGPDRINDGDTNTTVGGSYSWANGHTYTTDGLLPNWVQLAFDEVYNFTKVVLYSSQGYVIKDYDIQIWTGYTWETVVRQRNNTSISRTHSFTPLKGSIVRVLGLRGPDNQSIYARVNELEVYEAQPNMAPLAAASAQSSFPGYNASKINDGDTNTTVGGNYSWANGHTYATDGRLPNWVQLDFGEYKTFSKIVLYTSSGYEIKDYYIQVWTDTNWATVVRQTGNTSTRVEHEFAPISGSTIRVLGITGPVNQSIYVRVNELEVYY